MSKKFRWITELYLLVMVYITGQNAAIFLSPDTNISMFYRFLCAFDPLFSINYLANMLQVTLSVFHCFPFAFYIYRITTLPAHFWKMMLLVRLVSEIFGHKYDLYTLKALYQIQPEISILILGGYILFILPSYLACYRYAFNQATTSQHKMAP